MRIAVTGAGLAGLAAAAFLCRNGHEVTILERAEEPRPTGAGLLLQPPGTAILEMLGVAEILRPAAARITRLEGRTPGGRMLLDLDYTDLGPGIHGLGLTRPAIWGALHSAALSAGTRLRSGCPVASLEQDGETATIHLASGERIGADMAVVASGTHTAFWQPGGRYRSRPYPWGCLWATVPLPEGWPMHVLGQRCHGTGSMLGILPIQDGPAGRLGALYWSVRNDRASAALARPAAEWRDQVARLWPQAEEVVRGLEPRGMPHAVYRDVWADPPWHGRILAIGDAAHGTSPQLGQGTTQALRDALGLAQSLDQPGSLEERLAGYWRNRRRRTRYYRWASRALTPVFQSSVPGLGTLRDLFAGPAGRLGPVQRTALLTLAGAKTGLLGSDAPASGCT